MSQMLGEMFKRDPVELKTSLEGGNREGKMDHSSCFPLLQQLLSAPASPARWEGFAPNLVFYPCGRTGQDQGEGAGLRADFAASAL